MIPEVLVGPIRLAVLVGGLACSVSIGITCVVLGALRASQLIQLILLERQGKCDFVPCANDWTYLAAALYGILALTGVVVLAGVFLLIPGVYVGWIRRKSRPSS